MRLLIAILCAGLHGLPAAQSVYRCDGADGVPSFQQQPCAGVGRIVDATPVNAPLQAEPAVAARRADGGARAPVRGHGVAASRRHGRSRDASLAYACPSAQQIRAERVSASSITLSPAQRLSRERRIDEMERCGRTPRDGGRPKPRR